MGRRIGKEEEDGPAQKGKREKKKREGRPGFLAGLRDLLLFFFFLSAAFSFDLNLALA